MTYCLLEVKVKVNITLEQDTKPQKRSKGLAVLFLEPRVGGQRHALAALLPGVTRYPLYRRLGGPQGWSGHVRKISSSPGFVPGTFQLVESRYTD